MSASLYIRATDLSVGDVLLLPFNKTATIIDIKPYGKKALYVRFRTEYGWAKIGVGDQVHVEARVL